MGQNTGIEWTDATWNPVRGCTRVSEGCRNCYAERVAARFSDAGQPYHGFAERGRPGSKWTGAVAAIPAQIALPFRWQKPRRIFVNSMSDLFHEALPDHIIDEIFAVMALNPQHIFQVLTKRADRMRDYMSRRETAGQFGPDRHGSILRACSPFLTTYRLADPKRPELWTPQGRCKALEFAWPLPNVWLGVSVEHQEAADERIPHLLQTPAAKRFLSCEPLLGPVDLMNDGNGPLCGQEPTFAEIKGPNAIHFLRHGGPRVDWVIAGGESGPAARPSHPDWFRALRDQCVAASVPFFFKQWGEWVPWQPGQEQTTQCQDGRSMRRNGLPDIGLADNHLRWNDDLTFSGAPCVHERVGKKAAGAMLDGREWREVPA